MSVAYSIMEHLKVKKADNSDYSLPVEIMNGQLAALAALMVTGEANVYRMNLVADGVEYGFPGTKLHPSTRRSFKPCRRQKRSTFQSITITSGAPDGRCTSWSVRLR